MKAITPPKRPKAPRIRLVAESAPWVLISKASEESALTELQIRNSGVPRRKFGNADYIRPAELNAWILADGTKECQ